MLDAFVKNIEEQELFGRKDRILLTVSGGIDSMAMARLMLEAGYDCGIAHCNFQLRGAEADGDEKLVENYARKNDTPYYSVKFDTKGYAGAKGISIQMAARELRYEWFEKIRLENGYDYIAVAHNSDDLVETFLINLSRGTGIRGLSGMKIKNGRIVRPLMFASRADIERVQIKYGLAFREDSSNASVKYSRNKLRHIIIPEFEKINPSFRDSLIATASRLSNTADVFLEEVNRQREKLVRTEGDKVLIDVAGLRKLGEPELFLFEFLSPFAFPNESVGDIFSAANSPGRQFHSPTHRLVVDRSNLIIVSRQEGTGEKEVQAEYLIDKSSLEHGLLQQEAFHLHKPVKLSLSTEKVGPDYKPARSRDMAFLDMDKLEFPLRLRKWNEGDRFMPLGMDKMKKLSDFFIDEKLSLVDKENSWLLLSDNDIVWVIGRRIDHRFRISDTTSQVLLIELKK